MANKTVMRLAILIGVFALVGGGGYFLWAYQVERLANGVVARADAAEKAGKYADAEQLYREHLAVMPDDIEVKREFCRGDPQESGVVAAAGGSADDLRFHPGTAHRPRRRAAAGGGAGRRDRRVQEAGTRLEILLKTGRARRPSRVSDGPVPRAGGRLRRHAEFYGSAVEHRAPERIEAVRLRATLLRDKLGEKAEADKVIDAMVKSDPDDYPPPSTSRRGQYRRLRDGKGAATTSARRCNWPPSGPKCT